MALIHWESTGMGELVWRKNGIGRKKKIDQLERIQLRTKALSIGKR